VFNLAELNGLDGLDQVIRSHQKRWRNRDSEGANQKSQWLMGDFPQHQQTIFSLVHLSSSSLVIL
jgi:hypothetical protein